MNKRIIISMVLDVVFAIIVYSLGFSDGKKQESRKHELAHRELHKIASLQSDDK